MNLSGIALIFAALLTSSPADARIKRDHKAVAAFKYHNPCPSTGKQRGACPGWIVDHRIALSCGGADAPVNMQWQTVSNAKAKDKWERKYCKN